MKTLTIRFVSGTTLSRYRQIANFLNTLSEIAHVDAKPPALDDRHRKILRRLQVSAATRYDLCGMLGIGAKRLKPLLDALVWHELIDEDHHGFLSVRENAEESSEIP